MLEYRISRAEIVLTIEQQMQRRTEIGAVIVNINRNITIASERSSPYTLRSSLINPEEEDAASVELVTVTGVDTMVGDGDAWYVV